MPKKGEVQREKPGAESLRKDRTVATKSAFVFVSLYTHYLILFERSGPVLQQLRKSIHLLIWITTLPVAVISKHSKGSFQIVTFHVGTFLIMVIFRTRCLIQSCDCVLFLYLSCCWRHVYCLIYVRTAIHTALIIKIFVHLWLTSSSLSLSPPSVDKLHLMLTELCSSYSLCSDIIVHDHIVVPTEFLLSHLEIRLSEYAMWGLGWGGDYHRCQNQLAPEV